jgi:quercetin dioxygenase-like cupin family protein
MKHYDPRSIAAAAVAANPTRPAMTVAHDHADGRLVVFRIEPGQQVPTHTNASSVFLTVAEGTGYVSDSVAEHPVSPGAILAFAPGEPHGMRADAERLVIAALITPRPGSR